MGTLIPFKSSHTQSTLAGGFLRPLDAEGVLIARTDRARTRTVLWTLAGDEITTHLERVCTWRADHRDTEWHAGDYSFCVLEFANGAGASLFLQFWSEPDERAVAFEVCSGACNEAAARHIGKKRQDDLRDRGFETGGDAGNFCKSVCADSPAAIRSLAREAVGILCRVLGYDGTVDLKYHLHLGTRLETQAVHTGLNCEDLAKLLRGWGCRVDPRINDETGQPMPNTLMCRYGGYAFHAWLSRGMSRHESQYGVVCFRRYLSDKSLPLAQLANHINASLLGMQASLDQDGDMLLDQVMVIDGGVTSNNLYAQLLLWHVNLESVRNMTQPGDAAAG